MGLMKRKPLFLEENCENSGKLLARVKKFLKVFIIILFHIYENKVWSLESLYVVTSISPILIKTGTDEEKTFVSGRKL